MVGENIFVTNPQIIAKAIREGAANAVLIKLNQIGTVSETLEAMSTAQSGVRPRRQPPVRRNPGRLHRRLRGRDGCRADQDGAPCRGERVAMYNQLVRIEETLGAEARYAGAAFHKVGGFRNA